VLGKTGMEKVIEVDLNDAEKKAFANSVEHVKKTCAEVDKMLG
jgi:malate/lactate dehydrogenase